MATPPPELADPPPVPLTDEHRAIVHLSALVGLGRHLLAAQEASASQHSPAGRRLVADARRNFDKALTDAGSFVLEALRTSDIGRVSPTEGM
jgi:hypothetical protein